MDIVELRREATKASVSDEYGKAFREFDWSYAIDALPRRIQTKFGSFKRGEEATLRAMTKIVGQLSIEQGNEVTYAYVLETGELGERHVHALLGNISRLTPSAVRGVFYRFGFGQTNVKLWHRRQHSGYYFKTLEKSRRGYEDANWEVGVTWNRRCKQQMKLNRRHLERSHADYVAA